MATYTIYQTDRLADGDPDECTAFISEGFCFGALVFGPLWLIVHRLWRGLAVFATLSLLLVLGHWLVGLSWPVVLFCLFLLAVALGLEGRSLLRERLIRRGYRLVDVVTAPGRSVAEAIYFNRREPAGAGRLRRSVSPALADEPFVIGTFPRPGGL
jgi:hypothetical protein